MSKAVALSAAVLAVCLSACGNEGVSPQNAADYAQNVTDLFRQSCVAADGDAALVGEFANANKLVLLSKKICRFACRNDGFGGIKHLEENGKRRRLLFELD